MANDFVTVLKHQELLKTKDIDSFELSIEEKTALYEQKLGCRITLVFSEGNCTVTLYKTNNYI